MKQRKTVLVAEDNPMQLKLYSMMFTLMDKQGIVGNVIYANNGSEAFELYKKHSNEIGVLMTDNQMPVMTGAELLESAVDYSFTNDVRLPSLVMVSGDVSDTALIQKVRKLGASFQEKPLAYKALSSVIEDGLAIDSAYVNNLDVAYVHGGKCDPVTLALLDELLKNDKVRSVLAADRFEEVALEGKKWGVVVTPAESVSGTIYCPLNLAYFTDRLTIPVVLGGDQSTVDMVTERGGLHVQDASGLDKVVDLAMLKSQASRAGELMQRHWSK